MKAMAGYPVCDVQSANDIVDRISQLPDEVLVDILSLVTLNEVGRSSVLSKRWRNLWKMTGRLNFDGSLGKYDAGIPCYNNLDDRKKRRLDLMRSKFRTWVNEVLRVHECPSIEEFRVKYDLDASAAQDIDEWIKFMIRKRVKTVELDFSAMRRVSVVYTISKECCDYITSVSNLTNLMNIRTLRLNYVNVGGELLEYVLSKCPYLEVLSVIFSCTLLDLNVVGPPSLKYLECRNCTMVRSVKIEAPKLENFVYLGRAVKFYIGSNPRLTELDLGGGFGEEVTCALVTFRSVLRQLGTLTLRLELDEFSGEDLPSFGELSNLRHLILEFGLDYDMVVNNFTRLIAAAPVLGKLTLMFDLYRPVVDPQFTYHPYTLAAQPYGCLKEVEILGFGGGVSDVEMAKQVVTNAVNLEKLVIDPMHPRVRYRPDLPERLAKIEKHVKDLKGRLPLSAELVVVGM